MRYSVFNAGGTQGSNTNNQTHVGRTGDGVNITDNDHENDNN